MFSDPLVTRTCHNKSRKLQGFVTRSHRDGIKKTHWLMEMTGVTSTFGRAKQPNRWNVSVYTHSHTQHLEHIKTEQSEAGVSCL